MAEQDEEGGDLAKLHRQFRPALMAFFLRRVHNHAEAEDLTQEVFYRLANGALTGAQSADAYVFQTAANLLRDRARREKVRAEHRAAMLLAEGQGVDQLDPWRVAASRGSLVALEKGLAALPERTRQIFILYRIENIDKQVIADSFGIARRTVEKHVNAAMMFLARRIGDEF